MDTRPLVEQLKRSEQSLRRKIEELRKPVEQAEEDLKSIVGTIAFYERSADATANAAFDNIVMQIEFPLAKLHGLSHRQAVVAIARHNGGVIKAQDAKRLMIKAGVMRDTKNSTHMVHNAIITSDRFDRIGKGEFRLRVLGTVTSPSSTPAAAMAAGLFPPKNPVQ